MDFPRFKGYMQRGPNPARGQRRRKAWNKFKENVKDTFTKKPKEPKSGKMPKGKLTYLTDNDEPICTECATFKKGGSMKKVKGIGRWKGKDVPGMYQDGGAIDPSKMDSLLVNTPDGVKGPKLPRYEIGEKLDSLRREQAFTRAAQNIAAQLNEKAKQDLKRRR